MIANLSIIIAAYAIARLVEIIYRIWHEEKLSGSRAAVVILLGVAIFVIGISLADIIQSSIKTGESLNKTLENFSP